MQQIHSAYTFRQPVPSSTLVDLCRAVTRGKGFPHLQRSTVTAFNVYRSGVNVGIPAKERNQPQMYGRLLHCALLA